MKMYCTKCGREVQDEKFCVNCGQPIENNSETIYNCRTVVYKAVNAYKEMFCKCLQFDGRSSRSEFWYAMAVNEIIRILFFILLRLSGSDNPVAYIVIVIVYLYNWSVSIPEIALQVRRLHDLGVSGKCIWLCLIPIFGLIEACYILYLFFLDGQPGENQYGDNPKESY